MFWNCRHISVYMHGIYIIVITQLNNIVHLLKGGRNIFKINNICHQNLNGSRMDRSKIKTLYFKLWYPSIVEEY